MGRGTICVWMDVTGATDLHRFPVSVLTRHGRGLTRFVAAAFWLGSGLVLYGIWFDTRV